MRAAFEEPGDMQAKTFGTVEQDEIDPVGKIAAYRDAMADMLLADLEKVGRAE